MVDQLRIHLTLILFAFPMLTIGQDNLLPELIWEFAEEGSKEWKSATVPGTVHTDLLAHGDIQDPFRGTGEQDAAWVSERNWTYRCQPFRFKKRKTDEHVLLQFEGLDTYAKVFLNDSLILWTNNAFRSWEVEVRDLLKSKGNVLEIRFSSPTTMGETLSQFYAHPLPGDPLRAVTRKPQYHYGWDWGPALPSMGITGNIQLISYEDFRVKRSRIQVVEVSDSVAQLRGQFEVESDSPLLITCTIKSESNRSSHEFQVEPGIQVLELPFIITHPQRWWPNGLGEQKLYPLEVTFSNGIETDHSTPRIGIRTVELDTLKDRRGSRFMFRVNGVPVFAKGANYIPQDVFLNGSNPATYRRLIRDCKAANFNMLRVWGGGIYERDIFYDLCDEAGILVWQDFMFACAMYPGDEGFTANVTEEAVEHIWRLESHPCMALWCGNNENSEGWHRWGWQSGLSEDDREAVWDAYQTIFKETLPQLVAEHSLLPYWESSPSLGRGDERFSTLGDAHDWTVWHDAAPFERFEEVVPRFMSEFGFQSYPSKRALNFMIDSGLVSRAHPQVQLHQKHLRGESLIEEYMRRDFGMVPDSLEDFIYLSQVQQARGIAMGIRAQRRKMPYCMGSLYWQLNDCWPAISWSSIDYTGRWKALHHEAKRAFEPFLVSAEIVDSTLQVWCTIEGQTGGRKSGLKAEGLLTLMTFDHKFIAQLPITARLQENGNTLISKLPLAEVLNPGVAPGNWFARIEMEVGAQEFREVLLVNAPKHWTLSSDPVELSAKRKDNEWVVDVYSPEGAYWIELDAQLGTFSENYFHLEAGQRKRISFRPAVNMDFHPNFSAKHVGQVLKP